MCQRTPLPTLLVHSSNTHETERIYIITFENCLTKLGTGILLYSVSSGTASCLRFPALRDYGVLEPVRIDRHRAGPEALATPTPVAAPCRSGCPRRQPAGPRSGSRAMVSAAPGGRRPLWSARGATARTASSRLRGNRVRVRVRVRVRGPNPNPDTN